MTTDRSRSSAPLRAPLASVSALLVVSLFLGASLANAKPALREATRNAAAERVAVRQLTDSLARAVRHLVGSDQHKPCLRAAIPGSIGIAARAAAPVADERETTPPIALPRKGLLVLPPPAGPLA